MSECCAVVSARKQPRCPTPSIVLPTGIATQMLFDVYDGVPAHKSIVKITFFSGEYADSRGTMV